MDDKTFVYQIAKAADDKRAENIVVLDMKGVSLIADYFLICHGNSEKQVQAIADEVKKVAAEQGVFVKRVEGYQEARWILLDLENIIVHVFHKQDREYYNLEKLWGDVPRVDIEEKYLQ